MIVGEVVRRKGILIYCRNENPFSSFQRPAWQHNEKKFCDIGN
jgi:hypothetical protein